MCIGSQGEHISKGVPLSAVASLWEMERLRSTRLSHSYNSVYDLLIVSLPFFFFFWYYLLQPDAFAYEAKTWPGPRQFPSNQSEHRHLQTSGPLALDLLSHLQAGGAWAVELGGRFQALTGWALHWKCYVRAATDPSSCRTCCQYEQTWNLALAGNCLLFPSTFTSFSPSQNHKSNLTFVHLAPSSCSGQNRCLQDIALPSTHIPCADAAIPDLQNTRLHPLFPDHPLSSVSNSRPPKSKHNTTHPTQKKDIQPYSTTITAVERKTILLSHRIALSTIICITDPAPQQQQAIGSVGCILAHSPLPSLRRRLRRLSLCAVRT